MFPKIDVRIPPLVQLAFEHVPGVQYLIRGVLGEVVFVGITVSGNKIAPITAVSRWVVHAFLFTQVRDRVLRRKLTPRYGLGCKRPTISSSYYRMFNRPNVHLVTDPIAEVTSSGIRTTDGMHR